MPIRRQLNARFSPELRYGLSLRNVSFVPVLDLNESSAASPNGQQVLAALIGRPNGDNWGAKLTPRFGARRIRYPMLRV